MEFGTRRAFSPQASLWAARAALAGGLDSTSNVLAALQLGEKPSGTMAHALVMALSAIEGSEAEAFRAFHQYFPASPLLIDTYDTVAAIQHLRQKIQDGEMKLTGVRLDSGDLVTLSQQVRSLLPDISIFASGDLDEWEISRLIAAGAQINGYGLGTNLVTGTPVNGVYKLVEIDGIPVMKQSDNKLTYPGKKQIFRIFKAGKIQTDILGRSDERIDGGQPLLELVVKEGKQLQSPCDLATIRQRTMLTVASLPEATRRIDKPLAVDVEFSPALRELTEKTKKRVTSHHGTQ
jgi:nicotinate phosphoribosyltransferase